MIEKKSLIQNFQQPDEETTAPQQDNAQIAEALTLTRPDNSFTSVEHNCLSFFPPVPPDKQAAIDAKEQVIFPTEANVAELKSLLEKYPSLLLHPVTVKNRFGMEIYGTPYQIAIHEKDDELIKAIKPIFLEKIPDGTKVMAEQRATWLAEDALQTQTAALQHIAQVLDNVFTAFINASDPNDVIQLKKMPYTVTINKPEVNEALAAYRSALATLYQPTNQAITNGYDPSYWIFEQIAIRYEKNYYDLGFYNSPRNNALMCMVYGLTQRYAPINQLQAFAYGVEKIYNDGHSAERTFAYREWDDHNIFPHDEDTQFRLGYEYYASVYGSWAVRSGQEPLGYEHVDSVALFQTFNDNKTKNILYPCDIPDLYKRCSIM